MCAKKAAAHSTPKAEHAHESVRAWLRLLRVHKSVLTAVREELDRDVSLPRFDLLSTLDYEDGQTLASLSRHMLVTAGNVTGLVDRAERDGLVERRDHPTDRRATHVYLTRRGRALFSAARRRHQKCLDDQLQDLSTRELESLSLLLDKLVKKVKT